MRPAPLAAAFAVVLSSAGLAALLPDPGLPHYPHAPLRAHVALGPVQVLARPEPDPLHPAPSLAEAARTRYGAVDALVDVRPVALPGVPGGALSGRAVRWVAPAPVAGARSLAGSGLFRGHAERSGTAPS